jgi:hypothetical protein
MDTIGATQLREIRPISKNGSSTNERQEVQPHASVGSTNVQRVFDELALCVLEIDDTMGSLSALGSDAFAQFGAAGPRISLKQPLIDCLGIESPFARDAKARQFATAKEFVDRGRMNA